MARKIIAANYPKSFAGGNAPGGNLANYFTYDDDLEACFNELEAVTDSIVDTLNAAQLGDVDLIRDVILPPGVTQGRLAQGNAVLSTPSDNLVVTAGAIYIASRRVNVIARTFTEAEILDAYTTLGGVAPAEILVPCNVRADGILSIGALTGSDVGAIGGVRYNGTATTTIQDDLGDGLQPLWGGTVIGRLIDIGSETENITNPMLRMQSAGGVDQDAGWAHGNEASGAVWVSQRDGGEGTGSRVIAARYRPVGQLQLLEQARAIATSTAVDAGTSGAPASLVLETAVRREPASYLTNPFFDPTGSPTAMTVPAGGAYDGTYLVNGYVRFPSAVTGPELEAQIFAGGVIVAEGRVDKATSGDTTIPLAALCELTAGQTIAIRASTQSGSAETVDARLGAFLVGGAQ